MAKPELISDLCNCAFYSSEVFLVMRNRIQGCLTQLQDTDCKKMPACMGTQEPENRIIVSKTSTTLFRYSFTLIVSCLLSHGFRGIWDLPQPVAVSSWPLHGQDCVVLPVFPRGPSLMITHCCIRGNSCRSDILPVFNNSNAGFNYFNKEIWSMWLPILIMLVRFGRL